jgi:hypothetical protein
MTAASSVTVLKAVGEFVDYVANLEAFKLVE